MSKPGRGKTRYFTCPILTWRPNALLSDPARLSRNRTPLMLGGRKIASASRIAAATMNFLRVILHLSVHQVQRSPPPRHDDEMGCGVQKRSNALRNGPGREIVRCLIERPRNEERRPHDIFFG